MPITAGSTLGPYEIVALIGSGGMGEVYRARDTKLARDVAVKVLPALFTRDPERLARFHREAQVLASLNHPHIAHIYGLEKADSVEFLVLELVEGETLADRIARGALPLDEALPIARQIADALAAAHVHVSRAGEGASGRQAQRHLVVRPDRVRDASRPAGLRARNDDGNRRRRPSRRHPVERAPSQRP